MTRSRYREDTGKYLNSLAVDELFKRFQITRIGNITGLDCVGVPVYSTCRPAARVISVNAGKSRAPEMARAGAIAEGIEFATFENPVGEFRVAPFGNELDFAVAKDSEWTPETPIAQEFITKWIDNSQAIAPSDMVWMAWRTPERFEKHEVDFQMSSSGQAVGGSFEDAFIQGIYELVERDATTLRYASWDRFGVFPPRVGIEDSELYQICASAGLELYLLYCTVDIPIPVYWAILFDEFGGTGAFAGLGCDLDPGRAAQRACLEAIQSRVVFISGARDDVLRRDYSASKARDSRDDMAKFNSLPIHHKMNTKPTTDLEIDYELSLVLDRLGQFREQLYFKHVPLGDLHAVKAIIPTLEQPRSALWKPTRFITLAQAYSEQCRSLYQASCGDHQPRKATSCAT